MQFSRRGIIRDLDVGYLGVLIGAGLFGADQMATALRWLQFPLDQLTNQVPNGSSFVLLQEYVAVMVIPHHSRVPIRFTSLRINPTHLSH